MSIVVSTKRILRSFFHRCPGNVQRLLTSLRRKFIACNIKRKCRHDFKELKGKTELKVHLGCGEDVRPGWVNVDALRFIVPGFDPNAVENAIFIDHDLSSGLPLPESSCQYIYSSHFFEHLEYEQGLYLMRDCYRALRQGGTFRIVLPDFRRLFDAYLKNDTEYFELLDSVVASAIQPEHRSIVDFINYGVYQFGEHKCIHDQEKLKRVLFDIGFSSVIQSSYEESVDIEAPLRRRYSFYVNAVK